MAISDIYRAQQDALRNQQAFDQQAWQNAFNIANHFNKLSDGYTAMVDNRRKLQENFDTQAWRVNATNAENKYRFDTADGRTNALNAQNQAIVDSAPYKTQESIALSNLNGAKAQSEYDALKWMGQYAFDPSSQRVYTPQEQAVLGYQQGLAQSNPLLMQRFIQPAQTFAQTEAYNIAPYSPQYASQTRHQAGLSSTMLDTDNNIIDGNSGNIVGNTDNGSVPAPYFAAGTVRAYQDAQQKLQLEKQKQANKINQSSQVDLRNKQSMFDKAYQNALITDEITGLTRLDKEKFATEMARLSSVFGADDPYLTDFSYRVAGQQGWLEVETPQNNAPEQVTPPAGNSVPTGGIPLPKPR